MYTEEQKINNRFAITIFITAVFICVAGLFFAAFQIVQQRGDLKPIYIGSAAMAGVITLIYFIFFRTTLTVSKDAYRITISFFSLFRKNLEIEHGSFSTWEYRKLKMIMDYGRIGYSTDPILKKTGFIMNGKNIFEITLASGRKIGFTAANTEMMMKAFKTYIPNKEKR